MSRAPLPKRVWILGWISLFADVASEMVYPIIPIFMTAVVGAPVAALGAVEGGAEAIVAFMKGWSGWHSDKTGKRVIFVRIGYALSALGKPLLALAYAWPTVLTARGTDRFGKGLRTTARDALLADSVEKPQYGAAFGLHRAMDTTGAFLGGVLALVLLELLVFKETDLRKIFLIAAIPGALSVALTFFLSDRSRSASSEANSDNLAASPSAPKLSEMPLGYWRAVTITLIFGLANSSDTFLLLRANGIFSQNLKADPSNYGWALGAFSHNLLTFGAPLVLTTLGYLLYNITYVALSYPAGLLSDRVGRWPILAAGFAVYAAVYAGFGFASNAVVWLLFAFYGVYAGLTDGVGKALVADHAPKHAKGTALGFFYMASGITTLLGNIIAGILWDHSGPRATFIFGATLAALAILLIPLTKGMERAKPTAT